VIEAGDWVDSDGDTIPFAANNITINRGLKWHDVTSQPKTQLGSKTYSANVAKALGGGSAINGMIYDCGSAADYNMWGGPRKRRLRVRSIQKYFIKSTTYQRLRKSLSPLASHGILPPTAMDR
jgi:hypothetical protein